MSFLVPQLAYGQCTTPTITVSNACIGGGNIIFTQSGGGVEGTWTVDGGGSINAYTGEFSPSTPGCFTATYTTPTGGCSDSKSFVVFPSLSSISVANTCASALVVPALTAVNGFTAEYSFDGGMTWTSNNTSTSTSPRCYNIQARYKLTSACGSTTANAVSTAAACDPVSTNAVIFPSAPVINPRAYTCASAFRLPSVASVTGFKVEYSIDAGTYAQNPTVPTTLGCHTVMARYVLAAACGSTAAGSSGPGSCANSNTVQVLIFPASPTITAPENTCASAFVLPSLEAISGFNIEYSIDGNDYMASPTVPSSAGCYTITARYVLAATCGSDPAGTSYCGYSNTVSVTIFPSAPVLTAPTNTNASAFTLPDVSAVAGFDVEYSIDGGDYALAPVVPTTPGCHTVTARYVLTDGCESIAAGTAAPISCGVSNMVSVVIFPTAPVITAPDNTCASAFVLPSVTALSGFNVEYSIDGGTYAQMPTVPTLPGCHTVTARYVLSADCGATIAGTADGVSNTVNVVIFPNAPSITAPANTCASAFVLPSVTVVGGFNIEYSIDGGAYASSPTVPTSLGCHTVSARYVLAATCGSTTAGTVGTGSCGVSDAVNVVIFPNAPVITAPTNTCASAFTLPSVTAVSGFAIEYSIDGGTYAQMPTVPSTAGCHTITARYVLAAACGSIAAGSASPITCEASNTVSVLIFPTAPVITAPDNTCASAFTLPSVTAVTGFNVEYSIDGGTYAASPTVPTSLGCHTVSARYSLAATCGSTTAGTVGTGSCGVSNTVNVVIFPNAPMITAPTNTCGSAFTLPSVTAVTGFDIEYSIDGGAYAQMPTVPSTAGCHTVTARYVLAAACGSIAAGSARSKCLRSE